MATPLYELIRERASRYPTAIALGGQSGLGWKTLTSRQLLSAVDGLATELADRWAIGSGDRVVLWMPNSWRAPIYFFALWRLGAIVVPFDREMNPGAARRIVELVEPRCIVAGYDERPSWTEGLRGLVDWWEPGASGALAPDPPRAAPTEEVAAIYYTSGTTGQPKGCTITHANLCFEVSALRDRILLDPSCRLASILPLSHLFELTCGLLYPLAMGAAIHYIPSRRGPDVVRVLQEQRITHMIAVPQLLTVMGRALDEQLRARLPVPLYRAVNAAASRLSSPAARRRLYFLVHQKLGGHLRMLASGGAPLPAETQRLWERLGVEVVQGYGTSECSPVVAAGAADGSAPIGSVGKPLAGVDVRLSAEGELLVRGPCVMRGYWRDPERTGEVVRDGWYATGDLARIDDRGNLWILGRLKDLIVLPSGVKVWPQDVEDALRAHPAVKDAAVVAVPTASGGASLHAYLIPAHADPSQTDLTAIVAWTNGRLAQHQRVATASWWRSDTGDFPRTSTLKVRRHLLPPPDGGASVKVESVLAADDPVGQAIAGAARVAGPRDQQTLAELGIDSLGLVELALLLEEKTGKPVSDGDLRLELTVEQVRHYVASIPVEAADGEDEGHGPASETRVPLWPYTWGRVFRSLSFPLEILYRRAVTRTVVLGAEHLAALPGRVIFAGTHRSYADLFLLQSALAGTPASRLARRLVVATAATRYGAAGALAKLAMLAFGLYPLDQYRDRDASLRGLVDLARHDNAVLIFPQGRHVTAALEQAGDPAAHFRPGVGQLAAALDAAVVPFGVAGSDALIPPNPPPGFAGPVVAGIPLTIRRGPLAIAFGPPLRPGPDEDSRAFAARLEVTCFVLARRAENAIVPLP